MKFDPGCFLSLSILNPFVLQHRMLWSIILLRWQHVYTPYLQWPHICVFLLEVTSHLRKCLHHLSASQWSSEKYHQFCWGFFWPEGDQEWRRLCSSLAAVFSEVYRKSPLSADCAHHCAATENFQALFPRNWRSHHSDPFSLLVVCCLSTSFLGERQNDGGKWHSSFLLKIVLDMKLWNAGWCPQLAHVDFS